MFFLIASVSLSCRAGEADVKLLDARGLLAALVALLVLGSCGRAQPTEAEPAEGLDDVRAEIEASVADVAELHTRVVRLERRLLRAQSAHRRLRGDVRANRSRLEDSVAQLKKASEALGKKTSTAAEATAAAAETAATAARDLTVLTRRFDYHLRHPGK
jgi:septal ring factor EnvC (AmiA/AmiB activator)